MKKLILILILLLTFTLVGNCDWLAGWDYRIEFEIADYANDIGAEIVWFPVTVFLTATQGEEVFVELTTDAKYLKMQFTQSDGTSLLYGEKELFDVSEEKGIFHISRAGWTINANTSIFLYYDKDHEDNTDWISAADGLTFRPLVTFAFEDGVVSTYTDWKPLFDTQGEIACSAVVTGLVGGGSYMNWNQILELQAAGWEIENHTKTHPHLTTLNEAELRTEFEGAISDFAAEGIITPILGYPFAENNALVKSIAREYFRGARNKPTGEGGQGVNPQTLEPHNLMIQEADATVVATLKARVDTAKAGNRWVIFYAHEYTGDKGTKFNELIDYIQSEGVDIVTMTEGFDVFAPSYTNVWNREYKMVQHMVDETISTTKDSTHNNNDGTKTGANNPNQVIGQIGKAQEHTGNDESNSDITITDHADFDAQGDFSIMAVVYCDTFGDAEDTNYACCTFCKDDLTNRSWWFYIRGEEDAPNAGKQSFLYDIGEDTKVFSTNAISLTTWTQIGISFDNTGGSYTFYKNGVADGNASVDITPLNDGGDVSIGGGNVPNQWAHDWDGKICEVRYSDTNRSSAWTKAEYNSLWDSLLTYGSEETEEAVAVNAIFFGTNF